MTEDVGGTPFADGREPDDDRDHGVPDDGFASVVFDEAFVQAAPVHEPSAVERLLAAAQARAEASEAEARRGRTRSERPGDGYGPDDHDFPRDAAPDHSDEPEGADDPDGHESRYGTFGLYGRHVGWHRPVAWVLALVMGVGMVALAFAAVYRSASSGSRDAVVPPASTGLEPPGAAPPSAPADHSRPAVPVLPRTP
ncbi:hypothetical protein [Streptomyces sp. V3I7]|uniref:SCO2584 family spore wall biosynthesis protein n=1 Tax=Streptomyces sp. V3I7 TaxID=3042278 RepID=UPI002788DED3|nr:hypothetical protein [Streptomyces sp. V3I7]MDQ0990883.1 hypothetical protein [Streptomyces sp. V3I7]